MFREPQVALALLEDTMNLSNSISHLQWNDQGSHRQEQIATDQHVHVMNLELKSSIVISLKLSNMLQSDTYIGK